MANATTDELGILLDYLKRNRGFDFSGYKHSSLARRIKKRMHTVNVDNYSNYVDYLELHPEEFIHLFNTILINVTSFFRDPAAWAYIGSEIIPRILKAKIVTETIRVWCAGVASGEEAYTVAILLAEALGTEEFHKRVKIYASDVDEEALNQARAATYIQREVSGIEPDLVNKYFEQPDHRFSFRKDFRRSIIFGRHDLIQDAPISHIDLLICRNTLMYFNADTQAKILSRFHFALNDSGFLFLGKAEMLFTHTNLFTPVDLKLRVFVKVPRLGLRDRLLILAQSGNEENANLLARHVRFREAAFDAGPVAQMTIDLNGLVSMVNERTRALFGLSAADVGRPLFELDLAHRLPDLRARIDESHAERRATKLSEMQWVSAVDEVRTFEIVVTPLLDTAGGVLGTSIAFNDTTRYKRLQEDLEHANQELETAYEELQSTNEELETTNEELQSTNEELQTINEELQSTNEELQTINEEFRRRGEELNQTNAFLESILISMRGGVIVVDSELQVQRWNDRAEDLWGLRSSEVQGKNLLNLDIGLPVEQLKQPIRAVLAHERDFSEVFLVATNRRGKPIRCKVTLTPLYNADHAPRGIILTMEDVDPQATAP